MGEATTPPGPRAVSVGAGGVGWVGRAKGRRVSSSGLAGAGPAAPGFAGPDVGGAGAPAWLLVSSCAGVAAAPGLVSDEDATAPRTRNDLR